MCQRQRRRQNGRIEITLMIGAEDERPIGRQLFHATDLEVKDVLGEQVDGPAEQVPEAADDGPLGW